MLPDPKERLVDPETGETPPLSPRHFSNLLADARPSPATFRNAIARLEAMLADPPPPPPPRAIVPVDLLDDLAPYLEPDDAA